MRERGVFSRKFSGKIRRCVVHLIFKVFSFRDLLRGCTPTNDSSIDFSWTFTSRGREMIAYNKQAFTALRLLYTFARMVIKKRDIQLFFNDIYFSIIWGNAIFYGPGKKSASDAKFPMVEIFMAKN